MTALGLGQSHRALTVAQQTPVSQPAAAPIEPSTQQSRAAILLLVLAFAMAYASIALELVRDWTRTADYAHGFVTAPFSAYLIWRAHRSTAQGAAPIRAGLLLFAASQIMLLAGLLGAEFFLARLSLPFAVAGATMFVSRRPLARSLFIPVALFVLTIPLPALIHLPLTLALQQLAAQLGVTLLSLAQVPALREGNVIVMARGSLEVAEACSGIRFLTALLTVGLVFGHLVNAPAAMRAVLTLAAVPIAVLANAVRVAFIGLAADRYGAIAIDGPLHLGSGVLVFATAAAAFPIVYRIGSAARAVRVEERC